MKIDFFIQQCHYKNDSDMWSLVFGRSGITQLHQLLGVEMASHEDAIQGRRSKGDGSHMDLLVPEGLEWWYVEGDDDTMHYIDEDGVEQTCDTSYSRNPSYNNNDYIMLKIGDEEFPIDWMIVNVLEELLKRGVTTLGSDQGMSAAEIEAVEEKWKYVTDEEMERGYIVLASESDVNKIYNIFKELTGGELYTRVMERKKRP